MLGKDIMVAPQIYESARSREIYLPEGDWFAYPGNASAEGKTWVTSHEKIPLFVRK
jgi:alpha-glucosidase (family GH31 glycosyl hydrolase)